MLGALVQSKLQSDNLTMRDGAKQSGVSHTTMARILQGSPVDIDTLVKVCDWLGIKPADALNSMSLDGDQQLVSSIAILVEREPVLAKLFKDALEEVAQGRLSTEDVREIIAFAAYRLGKGKINNAT